MCFKKIKRNFKLKTATGDIPVFKLVNRAANGCMVPCYYRNSGIKYVVNEKVESEIDISEENKFGIDMTVVNKALHSYLLKDSEIAQVPEQYAFITYRGLIKFTVPYLKKDVCFSDLFIMRCIIPKGAHYEFNDSGECISDAIVPQSFTFIKDVEKAKGNPWK